MTQSRTGTFLPSQAGVSIAELVVVIAIIGLLAALVAGATNIKGASEIRSFITDVNQFQVAIDGYTLKYDDLPGDMPDAEDYWGAVTENGDGDTHIEYSAALENEALRAWQHLNLAGFIEGGYAGVATVATNQADIGINVPTSRRSKVGYYLAYQDFVGRGDRNEIVLGAFTSGAPNSSSALTPQEANAIDRKMDDGNPADGVVYGANGADAASNCRNVANDAYLLTGEEMVCIMSFTINP